MHRRKRRKQSVPHSIAALDLAALPLVEPAKKIAQLSPLELPLKPETKSYITAYISRDGTARSSLSLRSPSIPESESQELGVQTPLGGPVYLEFAVELTPGSTLRNPRRPRHRRTQSLPPEYDLILRPSPQEKPAHRRTLSDPAVLLQAAAAVVELPSAPPLAIDIEPKVKTTGRRGHRRSASEPPTLELEADVAAKPDSSPNSGSPECYHCKMSGQPCSACRSPGVPVVNKTDSRAGKSGGKSHPNEVMCFNCKEKGHRSSQCTRACAYCREVGHWSRICPKNPRAPKAS